MMIILFINLLVLLFYNLSIYNLSIYDIYLGMWHLDSEGRFIGSDLNHNLPILNSLERIKSLCFPKPAVLSIYDDLEAIHESERREMPFFHTNKHEDDALNSRLMFLFQCDLIAGFQSKVIKDKTNRDKHIPSPKHALFRALAWLLILSQNGMMLSYVMLFALEQSEVNQRAWVYSFLLWIIIDIFLISTGTVILTHIILPRLVMSEVEKNKLRMIELIRKFHENVINQNGLMMTQVPNEVIGFDQSMKAANNNQEMKETNTSPFVFNAANYFFVSMRIAEKFPDLIVSRLIRQFVSHLPRKHHQYSASQSYGMSFLFISKGITLILFFIISGMIDLPPSIQDMLLEIVTTLGFGAVMMMFIDLYHIYPLLILLPIFVVSVVFHYIYVFENTLAKQRLMAVEKLTNNTRKEIKNNNNQRLQQRIEPLQINNKPQLFQSINGSNTPKSASEDSMVSLESGTGNKRKRFSNKESRSLFAQHLSRKASLYVQSLSSSQEEYHSYNNEIDNNHRVSESTTKYS